MELIKPKCKLPVFCASSHIIGKTVNTLRNAGLNEKQIEFVQIIKNNSADIDYFRAIEIASKFVDFYD